MEEEAGVESTADGGHLILFHSPIIYSPSEAMKKKM